MQSPYRLAALNYSRLEYEKIGEHVMERWAPPTTSASGLGSPCHLCAGIGLPPPHLRRDRAPPLPHLHQAWAHPCIICAERRAPQVHSSTPRTLEYRCRLAYGEKMQPFHPLTLLQARGCVRARVCVRAWVRACVRACVSPCVCVSLCVRVHIAVAVQNLGLLYEQLNWPRQVCEYSEHPILTKEGEY